MTKSNVHDYIKWEKSKVQKDVSNMLLFGLKKTWKNKYIVCAHACFSCNIVRRTAEKLVNLFWRREILE